MSATTARQIPPSNKQSYNTFTVRRKPITIQNNIW